MLNLAPAESKDASRAGSWSGYTILCLFGWYFHGVVSGVRGIYAASSALDVLLPFAVQASLGLWVLDDARRRGYAIPMLSQSWVFLFAAVVAPIYLVWSRGWRGFGLVVLNLLVWGALATTGFFVAGRLVYGANWRGM